MLNPGTLECITGGAIELDLCQCALGSGRLVREYAALAPHRSDKLVNGH